MSAPQTGVSDESMVVVAEEPKSVGWHDHHGMELTHVREFEPRYASGAPLRPFPARRSRCQPYSLRNGTAESVTTKPERFPTRRGSDLPLPTASRVTQTTNGDRREAAATPARGVA